MVSLRDREQNRSKPLVVGYCPTEEDAFRLRCIGLLLLAPKIGYGLKHNVHDAEWRVRQDPLYLELQEAGTLTVDDVQQRLLAEGRRLSREKKHVPPAYELEDVEG